MRAEGKPTQGSVTEGTPEGSWNLVIKSALLTAPRTGLERIMGSSCSLLEVPLVRNLPNFGCTGVLVSWAPEGCRAKKCQGRK